MPPKDNAAKFTTSFNAGTHMSNIFIFYFSYFFKEREKAREAESRGTYWIFEGLYANRVSQNAFGIIASYSENQVYVQRLI